MANLQPCSSGAVQVQFPSENITIAGGVAIFHIASQRVVVCRHSVHEYWFLPKGRRDAGEESGKGAEREGYEEVSSKDAWGIASMLRFGSMRWLWFGIKLRVG